MIKIVKNYSTTIPANTTIGEIQTLLAKNGARGIATEYDSQGRVTDLFFKIKISDRELAFRLPVKTDRINQALQKSGIRVRSKPEDVAWRICKEWLEIQLTLISLDQVKMEEIFLPYLIMPNNKTLFETMEKNQFLLS